MSLLRRTRALGIVIALTFLQSSGSASQQPAPVVGSVEVFESSSDLKELLQQKPSIEFHDSSTTPLTITVDDTVTYQQMDGFGASITDSSGWLMYNKLSSEQRTDLMEKLFDPVKGIGLSFIRQPMGASDFALKDYSYDDVPAGETDSDLTQFSIDHDRAYILPLLRQAVALNPPLKVMATPWSPPGWMKTSGTMRKGLLMKSAYPALANYFVKFIKAYAAEGVPIYAVTMQNEPLYSPPDYPGTVITAKEQAEFIGEYLGPAFREQGISTKIMVFDHNWDLIDYAKKVLRDPPAASYAAGTAVHCYGGTAKAQTKLHMEFPEKEIWETECSGGDWEHGNLLRHQIDLVISATRNWAKSVVLWNLALDQDNGPYLGGCKTCRGLVKIDTSTSPSSVSMTVDYAALGHASKFVQPGAWRIDSNSLERDGLEDVAFRNPDGSIVVVALNSGKKKLSFGVRWSGREFAYTLDPGAAATFRWRPVESVEKQ